MLDEEIKDKIRTTLGELAQNIFGFKLRPTQNKMIAEVAKTLSGEYSNDKHTQNILAVEAPTGTGKTFAYLIPSIILAQQSEVKLIISSSNVALQEQLKQKDLVDIGKHTSLDFSFALVKGRSRYVCMRDLVRLVESDNEVNPLFATTFDVKVEVDEIQYLSELLAELEVGRWNGEIDSLSKQLSSSIWQKISCNRFSCSASRCEFYEDCVFFKQRKKLSQVDVLIANHDLILADIASGNNILPKLEDSFIIFDEAHHLAQKSLSHFDFESNLDNIVNICKQVENIQKKIIQNSDIESIIQITGIQDIIKEINNYVQNLSFADDIFLFNNGVVDEDLTIMAHNLLISLAQLENKFDTLSEKWQDYLQTSSCDNLLKTNLAEAITNTQMQLISNITTFDNFSKKDENIPQARWVSRKIIGKNNVNYYLHSAKISVASELQDMLFSKVKAAILTSATLSSLGSFKRLDDTLGIDKTCVNYLRLPSPFEAKNARFIIARMQHNPKAFEHTDEVAGQILMRVNKLKIGGVLVLFASNSQMQKVSDLLSAKLPNLLVQGDGSKSQILSRHMQLIDKNEKSVIFGLDSFAEGVDLKGDYLKLVLIAKLRFAVPNSPLEKTTNDYLMSIGKNPFMISALPDAALKLIQACGRLLRLESDSGEIIIFDNRLITTRWGKVILDNLPDYELVVE
jgi:ATP-dependent DNA helicase DinG